MIILGVIGYIMVGIGVGVVGYQDGKGMWTQRPRVIVATTCALIWPVILGVAIGRAAK